MRIIVILKHDAVASVVLNTLYKIRRCKPRSR